MANLKTAAEAIEEQAEKIGYGEWVVKLIIYDGRVTGFDQVEQPLIKFREQRMKKEA
jgi:hypothetical protein